MYTNDPTIEDLSTATSAVSQPVAPVTPLQAQPLAPVEAPVAPDQSQAETNRLLQQEQQATQPEMATRSLSQQATQPGTTTPEQLDLGSAFGTGLKMPGGGMEHHYATLNNGDRTQLMSLATNPTTPPHIMRDAVGRLYRDLDTEKKTEEARQRYEDYIAKGNVQGLMKEMNNPREEGSHFKAWLYNQLGFKDLAAKEQEKISPSITSSAATVNGENYHIKQNKSGEIVEAYTPEGKPVDRATLSQLNANYLTMKGAQTGQTMGFDKAGNTISHTVLPNGRGVQWKNETTGQILSTAPEGYHTGKDQRSMLADSAYKQSLTADETENRKQLAAGLPPMFSKEQMETRAHAKRNSILGLGETNAVEPSAVAPTAATAAAVPQFKDSSIKIISGTRSNQEQQALYDQSVKNGTPGVLPNGNPVARPGTSLHETGNALDIDASKLTKAGRQELAQAGYYQPLPQQDPNHWERHGVTAGAPTAAPASALAGDLETQAQAIARGDVPMPTGMGANNRRNQALQNRVYQINPQYDPTVYKVREKTEKDFSTGKQGEAVKTMNVAVDHLDTLQGAATALKNGNLPIFNKIANDYAKNTGQPAVTDFNALKSIVGSEVAKAVAGGATALGDREEIRKEIDAANSPAQLAGVIHKYQKLLTGQLSGLETEYKAGGGTDEKWQKKLNDRTRAILEPHKNAAPEPYRDANKEARYQEWLKKHPEFQGNK